MSDCSALCTPTSDGCTDSVMAIVESVVALVVAIAAACTGVVDIMAIITSLGSIAEDLAYGLCPVETSTSAIEFFSRF